MHVGVGIASAEGFCDWRRGHNFDWRPPWLGETGRALLVFVLQLRKSTDNLSWGSRIVLDTNPCVDLAAWIEGSLYWLAEHQSSSVSRGWLRTDLDMHRCLPSCRTKGFPSSANFESKFSALRCDQRQIKSPYPCEFPCY
jgi:hypothetical protein